MTWHSCSVFGCENTERKRMACTNNCIFRSPNNECNHQKQYPEMQNVKFYTFPKDKVLKKAWLHFIRRKDIKNISAITQNHTVCSIHFKLGLGPVKADPVPTVHGESSPLYQIPRAKRKLPLERSVLRENQENVRTKKKPRPQAEWKACSESQPDIRTNNNDHDYAATGNCIGTQTDIIGEDISDLQRVKEHCEDKSTMKRELFIQDITANDEKVKFYTGFQNHALLLSVFDVIKTAADKLCYSGNCNEQSPSKAYMVNLKCF